MARSLVAERAQRAPNRGPFLVALMWVLTTLAFATVALRIVFRSRARKFGYPDVFMIVSMVCMFGWSISLTIFCNRGGEEHISDVQKLGMDNLAVVQFLDWLSQVFGILGVAAGKISVSALLLSILRDTGLRWHSLFLWVVTIGLASAVAVSCSILTMAQCSPAEALWDSRVEGRCIDSKVMSSYGIFTGSFNTFADGSLAILPATVFWKLSSNPLHRIQLSMVFGLNILTCICSGIKTQYLAQLANRTDLTWATFDIFAWVTVELFLMIVCGTVPTLHPVLVAVQSVIEKLKGRVRGNSYGDQHGPGSGPTPNHTNHPNELMTIGRRRTGRIKPPSDTTQNHSSDHLFGGGESLHTDVSFEVNGKRVSTRSEVHQG